jgi:hypothetical protein
MRATNPKQQQQQMFVEPISLVGPTPAGLKSTAELEKVLRETGQYEAPRGVGGSRRGAA